MYSAIVCVDRNWKMVTGREGDVLPRINHHLKKVERLTKGHKCILGHKAYDAGLFNHLPLDFVVYSSYPEVELDVPVVHDLAFKCVMGHEWYDNKGKEVFILGGLSMFKQHLLAIRKLYVTFIDAEYDKENEADKSLYFPFEEWMNSVEFDVRISIDTITEYIQDREYEVKSLRGYNDTTDSSGTVHRTGGDIASSESSGTGNDAMGDRLQIGELELPTLDDAADYIRQKFRWEHDD